MNGTRRLLVVHAVPGSTGVLGRMRKAGRAGSVLVVLQTTHTFLISYFTRKVRQEF